MNQLPKPLKLFMLVNLGLTVLCLLAEGISGSMGLPRRYCEPFFITKPYTDFTMFRDRFDQLHDAAFFASGATFPFTYPAPAAVFYAVFYKAGVGPDLNWFLAFLAFGLLVMAILFAQSLWRRGVSAAAAAAYAVGVALLAFPFWFGFQRGNIEFAVVLAIAAGIYALLARRGYWAAGFFGLAASMKLLPVIYLGLFLYRRQYRQALFGAVVMAAATILSLMFAGPTLGAAWRGIAQGLEFFRTTYVLGSPQGSMGWDHSLLALYRQFGVVSSGGATVYAALTAAVGVASFFWRIVRLPLINQVLCLSVAAVWLAPVSFEYTLMGLYGAFAMLAVATLRFGHEQQQRVVPVFIMLGVLCSPLSEVIWRGVQYGGQVKCLLLGAVFLFGLIRPLPSEWDEPPLLHRELLDEERVHVGGDVELLG